MTAAGDSSSVTRPTATLPVPEGLAGERLDAALARLFGLSRTRAAELVGAGDVLVDGSPGVKSDRVHAGAWLDVTVPAPPGAPQVVAEPVPGHARGARRRRPRRGRQAGGRRGPPEPRLDRADRGRRSGRRRLPDLHQRRGRAAGRRAPAGRRHQRADGRGQVRAGVHRCSSAPSRSARSTRSTTRSSRATRTRCAGTVDAPIDRHPTHDYRWAVVASGKPSITHYETLEAHRAASLLEINLETGRTHQIRVHMAALRHPCVGDLTYGADPTLSARLGLSRQWLHARAARRSSTRARGSAWS